jgi:signal transduction histidine kinase
MRFFSTLRAKLLIVMGILLITTLSVQYYLNVQREENNKKLNDRQQQALVSGLTLGVSGMTSQESLSKLVDKAKDTPLYDKYTDRRISDIIVITSDWEVWESLNPDYKPTQDAGGKIVYKKLADLQNLPPLKDADRLGEASGHFPNASTSDTDESPDAQQEAYAIPIQTGDQGVWHIMVILNVTKMETARREAALPLLYTLGILLGASMIAIVLVWRFTKPIRKLSEAAKQVADGDLQVRVKDDKRGDEVGLLAQRFNEMTAQLEKNRELEGQLQEAEKSAVVGRLASAIAHEIRNPLNYINLTLDHLRAKFVPGEPEKRETFEQLTSQLKTEVARINNQIGDFLRYSRPINLNLQAVAIYEVVEASMRIVEGQAEGLGIAHIILQSQPGLKVLGDPEILRSVFNNLFINAVQAMEKSGGKLSANIEPDGAFVKITVKDTGCSIPEENLPKIFEPYFSTKETGTGLGLAIVKRVIEKHNGTIDVVSAPDQGTEFIVKLPQA